MDWTTPEGLKKLKEMAERVWNAGIPFGEWSDLNREYILAAREAMPQLIVRIEELDGGVRRAIAALEKERGR